MNVKDILMNSVYGIGGSGGGGITPSGEIEITQNGTYDVTRYASADVDVPTSSPTLQTKTATPTKQAQSITPDSGYDGLERVNIDAIPAQYPDVSGDTVTENDVLTGKTFHKADGTQATGAYTPVVPSMQSKTATPTKQAQVITPDSGYDGLERVTVGAIPAQYPDVSQDTAVESDVAQGKTFHKADGTQATGTASGGGGNDDLKHIVQGDCDSSGIINIGTVKNVRNHLFSSNIDLKKVVGNIVNPHTDGSSASIASDAFSGCINLEEVDFTGSVDILDARAFNGCSKLKTVKGLNSIFYTNQYIFQNCAALEKIMIKLRKKTANDSSQGTVGKCSILGNLFYSCRSLETIYFDFAESFPDLTTISISASAINQCYNLTDIYVPWSEGDVANAPWGATNATIHYDTTYDANGDPIV